jgi:hypothetical protein
VRDLLVIVPSRGRPASVRRLVEAVRETCTAQTDLIFAFDSDDPVLAEAVVEADVATGAGCGGWVKGPRRSMGAWTNRVALDPPGSYRAFASLGDDHVPRTHGWDAMLLDAIGDLGGTGIAYGDDLLQQSLPTAAVVTADIVGALGWMCLPGAGHYCVDNTWLDLGEGAGCLAHRLDVIIEHLHPLGGKAPSDATYDDAGGFSVNHPDWLAYQQWRAGQMAADVATVKGLLV